MAHRGPLREVFGMLCIAIILPKSAKKATPASSNTGYIIDHDDGYVFNTNSVHTTPPTSGFLPLLLSFLCAFLFDIAEALAIMAFDEVLDHGSSLIFSVTQRALSRAVTFVTRRLQVFIPPRRAEVGEASTQTPQPQPVPEQLPHNTSTSESNIQALTDLQADLAGKEAQIAALTKTAKAKSDEIAALGQENARFSTNLRAILDPDGRNSDTEDLILVASGLNQQLRSRTRALEKKSEKIRKENREKEEEALETAARLTAGLEAEVTVLQEPTLGKESRDEEVKEAARKLSEAEKKAEAEAARAAELEGNLEKAQKAGEELRTKAERVEVVEKKAEEEERRVTELTQKLTKAQTDAEVLRNTAGRVEAAEKTAKEEATKAAELTQTLTTTRGEVEGLRNTAGRVGTVESSAAELRRNLRETREEADEEKRSNGRLIAKLAKTEEEVKRMEREATDIRRLKSELEKARKEADAAYQSGFTAAKLQQADHSEVAAGPEQQHGSVLPQDDVVRQNELREEGYYKAVSDCEAKGRHLINEAVNTERSEAAQRQRAAVFQREQELQALYQQQWNEQHEQLIQGTNASDMQGQNATTEMVGSLQGQLQAAVQRAIKAEQQLNNPHHPIQEARNWANAMKAEGAEHLRRAEAAEQQVEEAQAQARSLQAEVEKYRKGKLSQDGRLADAERQLAEAKKHRHTDLTIAELKAATHERDRAWALMEEWLNRSYDSSTREVVKGLIRANSHIKALEIKLQISTTKSSQTNFLKALDKADVAEAKLKELTKRFRQVLVPQCVAVNAKLMALRTLIKADKEPAKEKLLLEIFKPRGDEEINWNDEKTEFDAVTVESDADDDDDDDDEDKDGGSGTASSPSLPADPRTENHLKRKGSDDIEASRFGKPYDPLNMGMGMRPLEPRAFSFNAPSSIGSVAVNPTPAPANHKRIFTGLPLLAANMAGNASALPGLPPPEDQVLEFESSAATAEPDENYELPDGIPGLNFINNLQIMGRDAGVGSSDGEYQGHTIGDDEEEADTVWEGALDRTDLGDYTDFDDFDLYTQPSTGNADADTEPSTVRALDMTEQNYEEQEAEAAAAMHGMEQAPQNNDGQPQAEELEDNFHVDLD